MSCIALTLTKAQLVYLLVLVFVQFSIFLLGVGGWVGGGLVKEEGQLTIDFEKLKLSCLLSFLVDF